jgi:hypothetical protein
MLPDISFRHQKRSIVFDLLVELELRSRFNLGPYVVIQCEFSIPCREFAFADKFKDVLLSLADLDLMIVYLIRIISTK